MIDSCCSALVINFAIVMYFAPTYAKFMTRHAWSGISQGSKIWLGTGTALPRWVGDNTYTASDKKCSTRVNLSSSSCIRCHQSKQ